MPIDLDDPEVLETLPDHWQKPRVRTGDRKPQPNEVLISKSLSRLLRHQAKNEGIAITSDGWVRMDELLVWRGFKVKGRFSAPVTMEDIFNVVVQNDKQRFSLKHLKTTRNYNETTNEQGSLTDEDIEPITDVSSTEHAIAIYNSGKNTTPSHFFIRAAQGHSIVGITSEGVCSPISLDDPSSIPNVVVHGTFYGAWSSILKDGGLKRMRRNMVHFASGPALTEVFLDQDHKEKDTVPEKLGKENVISGMRRDAQILIYIDLQRCLEDVRERKLDMKWWRSENGVILTEGIHPESAEISTQSQTEDTTLDEEAVDKAKRIESLKKADKPLRLERIVPMKYWEVVVDIKSGLGVLWRQGEGVVKELPQNLENRGVPGGKGPRGPGRKNR